MVNGQDMMEDAKVDNEIFGENIYIRTPGIRFVKEAHGLIG